jgi:hypothetical protein
VSSDDVDSGVAEFIMPLTNHLGHLNRVCHPLFQVSMSFALSSTDIRLNDRNSWLTAQCEGQENSWHEASIDLNQCIGNRDGQLVWGETNFLLSCE